MATEADRRAAAAHRKTLADEQRVQYLREFNARRTMDALEKHRKRVERAERALTERRAEQLQLMLDGRQFGLTWDDLASSIGVTRQAVQKRVLAALDSSE